VYPPGAGLEPRRAARQLAERQGQTPDSPGTLLLRNVQQARRKSRLAGARRAQLRKDPKRSRPRAFHPRFARGTGRLEDALYRRRCPQPPKMPCFCVWASWASSASSATGPPGVTTSRVSSALRARHGAPRRCPLPPKMPTTPEDALFLRLGILGIFGIFGDRSPGRHHFSRFIRPSSAARCATSARKEQAILVCVTHALPRAGVNPGGACRPGKR
jgi:hypothetical protein